MKHGCYLSCDFGVQVAQVRLQSKSTPICLHAWCADTSEQQRCLSLLCTGFPATAVHSHLWFQPQNSTDSCHRNLPSGPYKMSECGLIGKRSKYAYPIPDGSQHYYSDNRDLPGLACVLSLCDFTSVHWPQGITCSALTPFKESLGFLFNKLKLIKQEQWCHDFHLTQSQNALYALEKKPRCSMNASSAKRPTIKLAKHRESFSWNLRHGRNILRSESWKNQGKNCWPNSGCSQLDAVTVWVFWQLWMPAVSIQ